jgi:quercetin dioxygenase-like cupin family protein
MQTNEGGAMPIIDHRTEPPLEPTDGREARRFVTKDTGAESLTIGELVMHNGAALRLHTHPTDETIILMEGSLQMIVGDESHNAAPGDTLLAPPETPHRLVNESGADARVYTIFPTDNPTTEYVD